MAALPKKETLDEKRARMKLILRELKALYPDARCSLNYSNPFELLVATILSAQCTDERVNRVVPALFQKYPTPHAMAQARITEIEKLIQSTGFFKSKAKSILESSQLLVEKHQGKVPRLMEELIQLRGVGRKTANVVLGNAYGIPGLVVDTHVGRLCRRMGFTLAQDPVQVESEMMKIVPESDWIFFSHLLIAHGRALCTARKPVCDRCKIAPRCAKKGVSLRPSSYRPS